MGKTYDPRAGSLREWLIALDDARLTAARGVSASFPRADPERPLFNLPDQQGAVDRGAFRITDCPWLPRTTVV
jgi:hypothetical protein